MDLRAGRLGEIGVRQGQYVTAGTQLMGLVPDVVWVTANMKETQMRNIRVGQPVTLTLAGECNAQSWESRPRGWWARLAAGWKKPDPAAVLADL